ncbi:DUF2330 domain-containing protein [Rariglobus hedericola]|nr:DUF2330 domain-containing protein [Rariglobus hedericola]
MLSMLGVWSAIVLGFIACTTPAIADGKVFAPVAVPQQVAMPDQRALLAWVNGVETLVIESAFIGEGADFAWVVPLPSKPEVFPATRGTLPAAVALMQPTVASAIPGAWIFAVLCGGIALVALFFGWLVIGLLVRSCVVLLGIAILAFIIATLTGSELAWWLSFGGGCMCLWPMRRWLRQNTSFGEILAVLMGAAVLLAIIIPTVGNVRYRAGESMAGKIIVERHTVGDHDVTLIAGIESEGVITWLEKNGYAFSDTARRIAIEHAAGGGWFVASRFTRDFASSGRSVPAPLAFRFAVKQAVYPMRLTGADATQPLTVELIAFGPSRATAEGLKVRTATPVRLGEPEAKKGWKIKKPLTNERLISHQELARWTAGTEVGTWLRGELSPLQMQKDIVLGWTGSTKAKGLFAVGEEDAWLNAAALSGIVALIGAMVVGLVFGTRPIPRKWAGLIASVALTGGLALRAFTPTVPVEKHPELQHWSDKRQVTQLAAIVLHNLPGLTSDNAIQSAFAKELAYYFPTFRIGDAPGEVLLQKLPDDSWRVLFFNAYGQPEFFEGNDVDLKLSAEKQKTSGP